MNIPYEILCMIPKNKIPMDEFGNNRFYLNFVNKVKNPNMTTAGINRTIMFNRRAGINKEGDLTQICIKNEKFKLRLPEDNGSNATYRDQGQDLITLELISDQLDNSLATFCILVNIKSFYNLLREIKSIKGGVLAGNYCLDIQDRGLLDIVLENPSDKEYKEARNVGKTLSTSKLTSKWKPGHVYLLKTREKVLYVGEVRNIVAKMDYWSPRRYSSFPIFANTYDDKYFRFIGDYSYTMVIEGAFINGSKNSIDMEKYKGYSIREFLRSYLNNKVIPSGSYQKAFSVWYGPKVAVDLGEYLEVDNPDITDEFKEVVNFTLDSVDINNTDEITSNKIKYLSSVIPEFLDNNETIRKNYIDYVMNQFTNYLANRKRYYTNAIPEVSDVFKNINFDDDYSKIRFIKEYFKSITEEELVVIVSKAIEEAKKR